jgi:hypothetical protein
LVGKNKQTNFDYNHTNLFWIEILCFLVSVALWRWEMMKGETRRKKKSSE